MAVPRFLHAVFGVLSSAAVLACGDVVAAPPRADSSPPADRARRVDPPPSGEVSVTHSVVETENQRKLLLVRGSHLGLELVRTDGTRVRWLTTTDAYDPRVTADGTTFYRASGERSWMRFDPATSLETRVAAPPEVVVEPRVTPVPRTYALTIQGDCFELVRAGRAPFRFGCSALAKATLAVSPAGRFAVVGIAENISSHAPYFAYLVDLHEGAIRALTSGAYPAPFARAGSNTPVTMPSSAYAFQRHLRVQFFGEDVLVVGALLVQIGRAAVLDELASYGDRPYPSEAIPSLLSRSPDADRCVLVATPSRVKSGAYAFARPTPLDPQVRVELESVLRIARDPSVARAERIRAAMVIAATQHRLGNTGDAMHAARLALALKQTAPAGADLDATFVPMACGYVQRGIAAPMGWDLYQRAPDVSVDGRAVRPCRGVEEPLEPLSSAPPRPRVPHPAVGPAWDDLTDAFQTTYVRMLKSAAYGEPLDPSLLDLLRRHAKRLFDAGISGSPDASVGAVIALSDTFSCADRRLALREADYPQAVEACARDGLGPSACDARRFAASFGIHPERGHVENFDLDTVFGPRPPTMGEQLSALGYDARRDDGRATRNRAWLRGLEATTLAMSSGYARARADAESCGPEAARFRDRASLIDLTATVTAVVLGEEGNAAPRTRDAVVDPTCER